MHPKRIALLAAILSSLAFTSVAQADTFTVDGLTADAYGAPTNGRVFLFHNLAGSRAQFDATVPPASTLVAAGYQVISTDEPYDHAAVDQSQALKAAFLSDSTAGQTYRDLWARDSHDLIAAANARYGAAPRLVMAGISWGGFSALLAACSNPEVDSYAVHIPAVDPNGLPEWSSVSLTNLKLTAQGCDTRLAAMPGYLSWGSDDTRVGTSGTKTLLPLLGDSVTSCEYPMGHDVPRFSMTGLTRWVIDGAGDCLPYAPDPVVAQPVSATPTAAATPPAAPAATPPVVALTPKPRARCNRSTRCESIVRRHKLFHVYNRHGKHPRWVYVRKASR